MSVSNSDNRISYAGNSVTTVFPAPFYFLADADVVVVTLNETTGEEIIKMLTTDYTVTGASDPDGGFVTMLTAPATGITLTVYRDPALTQTLSLVENDDLPSKELEKALDRGVLISQRLSDRIDRSFRLSDAFADTFDATLPTDLASSPGKAVVVNDTGTGLSLAENTTTNDTTRVLKAGDTMTGDLNMAAATAINLKDADSSNLVKLRAPSVVASDVTLDNELVYLDGVTSSIQTQLNAISSSKQIANLALATSVASNILTVAVKTNAAADASATDIVSIAFRNSTAATGTYIKRTITAALSMTVSASATLGHVSAQNQYVHVYALDNAGAVELAVSGQKIFDEGVLQNTTAMSASATSAYVLYSTTARTGVAVRYLGRLKSNQTVAGTWAANMSAIELWFGLTPDSASEVWVSNNSAFGSSNTNVCRFGTVQLNIGTALTLTQSSTLGDSITVNEDGRYAISACIACNNGADAALTKNSTSGASSALGTNFLTYANNVLSASNLLQSMSYCGFLAAGTVLRLNGNGSNAASTAAYLHVTKI